MGAEAASICNAEGVQRSKVFISWSGERSRCVAQNLGAWLEDVLQGVETFMSDTDIAAGDVWFEEIGDHLAESRFAIICVTPDNRDSTWLHFEAGAIGMSRSDGATRSAVVPYLVGLDTADLAPPLSLYQAVSADKEGTLRLVRSINARLPAPVDPGRLDRTYSRWWTELEAALAQVPETAESPIETHGRGERELLEEVLSLLRSQTRARRPTGASGPTVNVGSHRKPRVVGGPLIEQLAAILGGCDPDSIKILQSDDRLLVRVSGVEPPASELFVEDRIESEVRRYFPDMVSVEFAWEPS